MPTTLTTHSSSNVEVRSNVYLRSGVSLSDDKAFCTVVRGRSAIDKLLRKVSPHASVDEAAKLLTKLQFAEWMWARKCDICGCIPEGPVTRGGEIRIVFRCPRKQCLSRTLRPKTALLRVDIVAAACARSGMPPSETLRLALSAAWQGASAASVEKPIRRPYTVRLTPWEWYMLDVGEMESALSHYVKEPENNARSQSPSL